MTAPAEDERTSRAQATCAACGYSFEVPGEHAGKPVIFTCPSCNSQQTVTAEKLVEAPASVIWDDEEPAGVVWDEEEAEESRATVEFDDEPDAGIPVDLDDSEAPSPGAPAASIRADIEYYDDSEPPPAVATTPRLPDAQILQPAPEQPPAPAESTESGALQVEETPEDENYEVGGLELEDLSGYRRFARKAGEAAVTELAEDDFEELAEPEVIDEAPPERERAIPEHRPAAPKTPRARLEAEIDAIDARMARIRSDMQGSGSWNVDDARAVLTMPVEGRPAFWRRTRELITGAADYRMPCRLGPSGTTAPPVGSRLEEYRGLDVRRHVLRILGESGGTLPQVVLFTGPGLLAWLVFLFFVLTAQALTTWFMSLAGLAVMFPSIAFVWVLYRARFLPLHDVLRQFPIWEPRGFTAPGRRIYRLLCMMVIAAACLLLALTVATDWMRSGNSARRVDSAEEVEATGNS